MFHISISISLKSTFCIVLDYQSNWYIRILVEAILFCIYVWFYLADDVHTVYVETDDNPRVILCHLSKSAKVFQCRLDHIFSKGTELKFVTSATANIHMTGI